MIAIELDIARIAKQEGVLVEDSGILLGRSAGEQVRTRACFERFTPANELTLKLPAQTTVTPSFFIGFFDGTLGGFKDAEEVCAHIRLENATTTTHTNFLSAINTLIDDPSAQPRRPLVSFFR